MNERANHTSGHATPASRPPTRMASSARTNRPTRTRRMLFALLVSGTIAADFRQALADDQPIPAPGPAPAQVQAAESPPPASDDAPNSEAPNSEATPVTPNSNVNSPPAPPRRTVPAPPENKPGEPKKDSSRRLRLDAFRPRDTREPTPQPPKSYGPSIKARVIETTPLNELWRSKYGSPAPTRSSEPGSPDGANSGNRPNFTPNVEPTREPVTPGSRSAVDAAPISPNSPTTPTPNEALQSSNDLPLAPPLDPPLAKRSLSGNASPGTPRLDPSQAGQPRPPIGVELIDPAADPDDAAPLSSLPVRTAEPTQPIESSSPQSPQPVPTNLRPSVPAPLRQPATVRQPASPSTTQPTVPQPTVPQPARPQPTVRGPVAPTQPAEPEVNSPANSPRGTSNSTPANNAAPPVRAALPPAASPPTGSSGVAREDVFPSRYQGLTPGESSLDDVRHRLGTPLSERANAGELVLSYRSGPFRQVDVHVRNKVVDRIRVELMRPTPPDGVSRELQLEDFPEAWIEDEQGDLVGLAIPERGVTFELQPNVEATLVTHVVLGRVSAEAFRLRAEWQPDHPVERMLADLAYARQLDPAEPRSAVREAELLAALGEYSNALSRLDTALKINPRHPAIQVARAEVLARIERHAESFQLLQDLLKDSSTPEIYQLMAEHQLGNLAARGPTRAFDSALDHHRRATELAAPLVNDKRASVRRAAKRVLLEAHLGAANDIARGDFSDKPRMILKWLVTGQSVLSAVKDEYPDDARHEWRWSAAVMRIYAAEAGMPKPLDRVAEIRRYARAMLVETRDPAYQRQLHWETAEMLFDAMQIANAHNQHDLAIECIREAVEHAEAGAVGRDSTLERDFFLGRLYFHLGSLHALHHKDHSKAVEQYRKAATYFVRPLPDSAKIDMGRQGERLVSMGLSYWQIGDQEQGVRWTRQGAILMQDAVRAETLDPRALTVPYNNLARMYHDLGRTDEARVFTARASELSRPDAVIRR